MNIFETNTMTLTKSNGEIIAKHLDVQKDNVNIPWNMEVNTTIPTDWYDIYTIGWITPVPERSNYLVDEATNTKYSVFGNVAEYFDHLEFRVSRYSGVTP